VGHGTVSVLFSITEKTMHVGIAYFVAMRIQAHLLLARFIGRKEWLSMVYSMTKWPFASRPRGRLRGGRARESPARTQSEVPRGLS
jgi:hypothetical protein